MTVLGCLLVDTPENREAVALFNLPKPESENIFKPYKGSVEGTCKVCGRPIWIGPEGKKLVDLMEAEPYCMIDAGFYGMQHKIEPDDVVLLSDKKAGE